MREREVYMLYEMNEESNSRNDIHIIVHDIVKQGTIFGPNWAV